MAVKTKLYHSDELGRVTALDALPRHPRRVNCADRQVCCLTCHKCGGQLRRVLDGEYWCSTYGTYR